MALVTFNNLIKPDGSALVDQNDTIVQAIVFGPVDISQSKINYEEAVVEILFKPKVSIPSNVPAFDYIREMENLLKCIFKEVILTRLHPRTSISIMVQELYNSGSLLSTTVNAVCCALIDSGLPIKCPVAGVSIKLDDVSNCKYDLVFDNKMNIITLLTHGCSSERDINRAIDEGKKEAEKIFGTIRERVRQRFACN